MNVMAREPSRYAQDKLRDRGNLVERNFLNEIASPPDFVGMVSQ
jgi:hypothetical protein